MNIRVLLQLALAFIVSFGILFLPIAQVYAAYNPFEKACSINGGESDACKKQDPIIGSDGVIMTVTNFVALLAGIAAVVIMIIGGLQMATSGGDASKQASGRKAVIYAAVGLVGVLVARSIVALVINSIL